MKDSHFEIERKFLIRYPDLGWLEQAADWTEIEQTYLLPDDPGSSERVRKRGKNGIYTYTHTSKLTISAVRRLEREEEISLDEYDRLLQRADPGRRTIVKRRYCLHEHGLLYEIDVFPFWQDRAFLEIELKDENQSFPWPEQIICIREVTDDRRYTNSALAREIPQDNI